MRIAVSLVSERQDQKFTCRTRFPDIQSYRSVRTWLTLLLSCAMYHFVTAHFNPMMKSITSQLFSLCAASAADSTIDVHMVAGAQLPLHRRAPPMQCFCGPPFNWSEQHSSSSSSSRWCRHKTVVSSCPGGTQADGRGVLLSERLPADLHNKRQRLGTHRRPGRQRRTKTHKRH
jgi:hypothetical protein